MQKPKNFTHHKKNYEDVNDPTRDKVPTKPIKIPIPNMILHPLREYSLLVSVSGANNKIPPGMAKARPTTITATKINRIFVFSSIFLRFILLKENFFEY